MNTTPYLLFFLLLTGGAFLYDQRKRKAKEQQRILQLQKKVQAALEDESTPEPTTPFSSKLSEAGITTKLQQTRMQLQSGDAGEPPEKYKFFSNLVAKGMKAEEIAEVLDISTTEASQLVQLCGLNGCRN